MIVGEQIERLVRFVSQTSWDDVPETVRRHAKLVLLDTLGVILAGSEQPEVQAAAQSPDRSGGQGATVLRATSHTTHGPPPCLNGIAGRSIELCEGHRYVPVKAP